MRTGYNAIAMAECKEQFLGLFLLQQDSSISRVAELMSKTVSYPLSKVIASMVLAKYYLYLYGMGVMLNIENAMLVHRSHAYAYILETV